ncbi:aminoglycoside 6-adenylyltransferase [Paenibacillus baekrokdamisoli]|uniref:Aminoglycoside 6-adenylyltransferase n=1 Tax=Paenibacillus baekrokdamisoli TaxID=1712516 RepID=A0A3G9JGV6_9BACL|nr:aminoglycoside 6-adenylyltransferase [Paenibacillus baekrokdamisoli]MBB3073280.1 aminoglycoside 6-adenylyltransferase [Paenibacillus baekrokdamisoli]BBH23288.1 aminoglycoside 6-adenylyltransferase [Paenibacillus baekrokdamisoli]
MMIDMYKMLEERISNWGLCNNEIIAIYIVGSRAREDKPFDEFSDLDVVIFSTNPDYYFQNDEWLLDIGKVWTSFVFRTAGGDPEKLVLFEKGLQVDFLFRPIADLEHLIEHDQIPQGFQRGAKILLDKTGRGQQLVPRMTIAPQSNPITQDAFLQIVNMFGFACMYVGKQILRGEMWVVNQRDQDCKQLMLQMIEWHAKALHGDTYDTWHAGKFINKWADKDIAADLKHTFGGYDQNNSWKALLVSFELFSRLSTEVANIYHYTYPGNLISNIRTWLEEQHVDTY